MSLINQMLKDIDQRGKNEQLGGAASSRYVATDKPRPAWFYMVVGLVSSVVLALLVIWFLRPEPADSEATVEPAVAQPTVETRTISAVEAPPRRQTPPPQQTVVQDEPKPTGSSESEAVPQAESTVEVIDPVEIQPEPQQPVAPSSMNIARSEASPRELAQRYYDQGMSLLSQGRTRQGATRLQEALLLAPGFHEAREELAVYYFTRGFLSDALQVLERGLEQFPQEPRLILLQARMLERSGQQALALELVREVPARFPQHADIFILRGALAEQLEDYELAIATYESLLAWRGDQGSWWLGLALSYDAIQNDPQAIRAYERALGDPMLASASRTFIQERLEALR